MSDTFKKKAPWDEHLRSIIFAIVLAFIFRSFLFDPFHIPSSSMKDGLLVGDYLFVSKYSYGYSKYSFPFGGILPVEGRIGSSRPERGDVVVFRQPKNTRIDYIKRVIGLPGDRVQMKDGLLYINDQPVTQEKITDFVEKTDGQTITNTHRYKETLPNRVSYSVLDAEQGSIADNTFIYRVPDGHYFMMGDNRDNSQDSRFLDYVGFVPEELLIGKAQIVLFSIEEGTPIWQFWTWPWTVRTDRFFKNIK
jgi:signal peptidase I